MMNSFDDDRIRVIELDSIRFSPWFLVAVLAAILISTFTLASSPSTQPQQKSMEKQEPLTSFDAFHQLIEGNQRFATGKPIHPSQAVERRTEIASGQHPFAIILGCADSRVSPELVFDQGLGDLFVIRIAGQVIDDHAIASIEYAAEHLHVPLIVVLGHEKCGAVKAALDGGNLPGHLSSLTRSIQPALDASKGDRGDALDNAIQTHAKLVAAQLQATEPILSELVKSGKLKIVPARYDLDTGKVEWLGVDTRPSQISKK